MEEPKNSADALGLDDPAMQEYMKAHPEATALKEVMATPLVEKTNEEIKPIEKTHGSTTLENPLAEYGAPPPQAAKVDQSKAMVFRYITIVIGVILVLLVLFALFRILSVS